MNFAELKTNAGRRFARFVTDVVVPRPHLWRFFRGAIRFQFDSLAPSWDRMRMPEAFAPYDAALGAVPRPRRRELDLGTGTGTGAFSIARRFPETEVIGADISERMIAEARSLTPPEIRDRVHFEIADASELPYESGSFDLVGLGNMIPFFDELARVVAPDGYVFFAFSSGPDTPIYVPFDRLRRELAQRGFADFAEFTAGKGTALLARKRARP